MNIEQMDTQNVSDGIVVNGGWVSSKNELLMTSLTKYFSLFNICGSWACILYYVMVSKYICSFRYSCTYMYILKIAVYEVGVSIVEVNTR